MNDGKRKRSSVQTANTCHSVREQLTDIQATLDRVLSLVSSWHAQEAKP